jgi:hypothetical protein
MSFLVPLRTLVAAFLGSSAISLGLGTSGTAPTIPLHAVLTIPSGSGMSSPGLLTVAEPDPTVGGLDF